MEGTHRPTYTQIIKPKTACVFLASPNDGPMVVSARLRDIFRRPGLKVPSGTHGGAVGCRGVDDGKRSFLSSVSSGHQQQQLHLVADLHVYNVA